MDLHKFTLEITTFTYSSGTLRRTYSEMLCASLISTVSLIRYCIDNAKPTNDATVAMKQEQTNRAVFQPDL